MIFVKSFTQAHFPNLRNIPPKNASILTNLTLTVFGVLFHVIGIVSQFSCVHDNVVVCYWVRHD